jgi:hypothetical protein
VRQLEALDEQALQRAADGVAVGGRLDEDVRGERGKAGRDRPDMQIVHLDDVVETVLAEVRS